MDPVKERLWWKPSEIPEGQYVVAECQAPGCHGHRYLTRALMIEKAGDIPLNQIEPRLRCIARNGDKRGPACGGRMTLELGAPISRPPEANAAYPSLPGLPWAEGAPR